MVALSKLNKVTAIFLFRASKNSTKEEKLSGGSNYEQESESEPEGNGKQSSSESDSFKRNKRGANKRSPKGRRDIDDLKQVL